MSESLFLTRARIRKDAPIWALHNLLVPRDDSARTSASHNLVWTLFGDKPDRTRDFLWREADPGTFYLLSRRLPEDHHGIFAIDEPKRFAPQFAIGDRLGFSLRANATVAKAPTKGARGKPCDIVMDALRLVPRADRARNRLDLAEKNGTEWLSRQGENAGFRLLAKPAALHEEKDGRPARPAGNVVGYRVLQHRGERGRLGVLDFEGVLEVVNPVALVDRIAQGFGRARAFGCGLMLVRRLARADD
jgi:CRISPR system Cascade subunit CasE